MLRTLSIKLALLLCLFPACVHAQLVARIPGPGGFSSSAGVLSVVQHFHYTTTPSCNGTSTCAISVTSTGSGHALDVKLGLASTSAYPALSSISDNKSETWTSCSSCFLNATLAGPSYITLLDEYVLSSTSGVTTITVSTAANVPFWDVEVTELASTTGAIYFDTGGKVTTNVSTNCTSCVGVALTLNGSNDAIIQQGYPQIAITGISGGGGYTGFLDIDWNSVGFAAALNTSNGAAPTWAATSGVMVGNAIAFTTTPPPTNTFTFIESKSNGGNTCSSTGVTASFTTSTGNNEFLPVTWEGNSAGAAPTITDSAGDTFHIIQSQTSIGSASHLASGMGYFITGATAVTSVKITSSTNGNCSISAAHFTRTSGTWTVDQTGSASGTGITVTPYAGPSGGITTLQPSEVIIGWVSCQKISGSGGCTLGVNGSWTQGSQAYDGNGYANQLAYIIVSTTQSSLQSTGTVGTISSWQVFPGLVSVY